MTLFFQKSTRLLSAECKHVLTGASVNAMASRRQRVARDMFADPDCEDPDCDF